MKIFTDRGFQQLLDEQDTAIWHRDKRIRELEESVEALKLLLQDSDGKQEALMQDNRSLIANRDYLEEMARAAKRDLLARDKEIRELKLRLGSIESRWGTEAAI